MWKVIKNDIITVFDKLKELATCVSKDANEMLKRGERIQLLGMLILGSLAIALFSAVFIMVIILLVFVLHKVYYVPLMLLIAAYLYLSHKESKIQCGEHSHKLTN